MCLRAFFLSSGHLITRQLTSFLRLQLPHRHGDDCESAIINKNNPTAHACATCHLDVLPTQFYFFHAQNSRELKQHRTPPEEEMLFGDCLKTEVGPSGPRLPRLQSGVWLGGGVYLNRNLPLGTMCMWSVIQLCPTVGNPMDCSPPSSPVHGILQASILEWVAMPSSRGSSQPRDQIRVSWISCIDQVGSSPLSHLGSPIH